MRRTLRRKLAVGGVALLAAAFLATALLVDRFGQREQGMPPAEGPAQAIVILGARVDEQGRPGDSLRARTLRAVELFRQGAAPVIICTGGVGAHPPSEAAAAARLAIEHGVPAQAIVLEEHAKTTRENTRYTAAICRARGWTRVIAVSDPYHLWRVRRGFAREGISAATSPARECERNRRLLSRARWTAREVLAIARDLVEDLLRRRARAAQGQPRP